MAPPPIAVRPGPIAWMRENLFSSWLNVTLTVLSVLIVAYALPGLVKWAIIDATLAGTEVSVCKMIDANGYEVDAPGACWTFIKVRMNQLMFGLWYSANPDQIWRPILAFAILAALVTALVSPKMLSPHARVRLALASLFGYPLVAFALLHGGWLGLPISRTSDWGGLTLTLVLAIMGIVAALPIGILMALGRRSNLPAIRTVCILWIEFFRGTPLVTILFIGSVLLPLFFPGDVDLDKILRAMVAITIFQSAYTAEAIRGGLSALPRGQIEAAQALGMGYWQSTAFIVLPQALKISIPGIVNSFIELFKDTSLVLIIGLLDLLNMATTASRSPEWKGYAIEAFVFASVIYFIFCYGLSRYSQRLERSLDTGHGGGAKIAAH